MFYFLFRLILSIFCILFWGLLLHAFGSNAGWWVGGVSALVLMLLTVPRNERM